MEVNGTTNYLNVSDQETGVDIRIEAMSYTMYKIGAGINKYYFPIFAPIGIIGNILSFLVMTQPHNRHMSISLYIAALAVSDTVVLSFAFLTWVNMELEVAWPSDGLLFCQVQMVFISGFMCNSSYIIITMTFERFYSIIRPHRAASFNTVKRAKIVIVCILTATLTFNVPHFFLTSDEGYVCVPYGLNIGTIYSQMYFWTSCTTNFIIPFSSLLGMNCVIIYTLKNRLKPRSGGQGQGPGESGMKNSETQIFVILLLVAIAYFILCLPVFSMIFYLNIVDYTKSARAFAEYFIFYNVGQKTVYSNYGINFFLYVMSGTKFRTDLVGLFKAKQKPLHEVSRSTLRSKVVSSNTNGQQ